MNINELILHNLKKYNISVENNNILPLSKYINLILNWNKKIKLTSDNTITKILVRHIIDSLMILKLNFVSDCETFLDIGTGAGFPGIVLGLFLNKDITLIESNYKKVFFLNIVKNELKLKNISILNNRAEELARIDLYREKFDCVISRAVLNFFSAMELSFPFAKVNGNIIYYATNKNLHLIKNNFDKIKKLGSNEYNIFEYNLDNIKLYLFYVKKMWTTPLQYPETYNKIKKKHL
jgi:16S rRNA (guanine527-N7)-methyltransferase